ncbi:MAG: hypothetical protein GX455_10185 [Phycisphaerae bacterium]|nr:hypothetical protein [Phycisphaerae bacterium]
MALIPCNECGKEISDQVVMCPHCGISRRGFPYGNEFRSRTSLFGLPLVHIVYGPNLDPRTGKIRVAKGIIAIGGISIGIVSIGGFSTGLLSLGGLSLGGIAMGGVAVGLGAALGGLAIGTIAIGGCAVGWMALGGAAFGAHAFNGANADQWPQWIRSLFR